MPVCRFRFYKRPFPAPSPRTASSRLPSRQCVMVGLRPRPAQAQARAWRLLLSRSKIRHTSPKTAKAHAAFCANIISRRESPCQHLFMEISHTLHRGKTPPPGMRAPFKNGSRARKTAGIVLKESIFPGMAGPEIVTKLLSDFRKASVKIPQQASRCPFPADTPL